MSMSARSGLDSLLKRLPRPDGRGYYIPALRASPATSELETHSGYPHLQPIRFCAGSFSEVYERWWKFLTEPVTMHDDSSDLRIQFLCSRIRKFRDLNSQFSTGQNCSENGTTMLLGHGPSVA